MAEHLIPGSRRVVVVGVAALVISVACAPATAQTDPMRPPDAPAAAVSGNVEVSALKSILIAGNRAQAVIGDKVVPVGGTVGHARVESITASEVVLRDEQGLRTLKLFPGIEKHVLGSDASRGDDTKRNSREKHRK